MNDRLKACSEHLKTKWLQDAHELLTAAGVPEWVEVESMPGNSIPLRLQWYLSRRKDVTEAEKDGVCSELNEMERGKPDGQIVTGTPDIDTASVRSTAWLGQDNRGWLVEKGVAYAPDYLAICDGQWKWTKDHNEALRFARKQDAERAATCHKGVARIAEHSWA